MDATLTQMLLAKRKPKFNIAEGIRALGYGAGGRASEYRPMGGTEQDSTVENYLTKALIERSLPPTEEDIINKRYKEAATKNMERSANAPYKTDNSEALATLKYAHEKEMEAYKAALRANDPIRKQLAEANIRKIEKQIETMGKTEVPDLAKNINQVMGGVIPPEQLRPDVLTPRDIPQSFGSAEGGEVLGTPGQGEYLEGYEPEQFVPAVPGILRNRFGVSQTEASRKALGMPKTNDDYRNIDMLIKQFQKSGNYDLAREVEMRKGKYTPEEIYSFVEEYQNAD